MSLAQSEAELRNRVLALRRNTTWNDVAGEIGISPLSLRGWLRGKQVSWETLLKIEAWTINIEQIMAVFWAEHPAALAALQAATKGDL